jgi:hypothetical protein
MNEPIVSPWLFFWIGFADSLLGALVGVCVLGGMVLVIAYMVHIHNKRKLTDLYKWTAIYAMIWAMAVVVPTKDTMYKMLIAQNVTYERIDKLTTAGEKLGKDLHKTIKQDLVDIINATQKEKGKSNKDGGNRR